MQIKSSVPHMFLGAETSLMVLKDNLIWEEKKLL